MRISKPASEVNTVLRAKVQASLDDPRPNLSAEEAEVEMARFMENESKAARSATR
ncbi:stability determinant [Mesorhizobium helmanticense]|nr:stability determinant [Mesorhizobium helmanticense]